VLINKYTQLINEIDNEYNFFPTVFNNNSFKNYINLRQRIISKFVTLNNISNFNQLINKFNELRENYKYQIDNLKNKIFQIQYFKENINNKIERLEQDYKNYNYYLDEIKNLEENIQKNIKTNNKINNKTSNFFIDLKKDLLNIYIYVDNIEYGLSKNKLYYLYNKDGIQNIEIFQLNKIKNIKNIDNYINEDNLKDFIDKIINYFSKVNKNNFLENFLNNNENITPNNVKLFIDDFIKNSKELIIKLKELLKNILKNNIKFNKDKLNNKNLLNQFYYKILIPKLIKKYNITKINNNNKLIKKNNNPLNINLSKKLNYQLILPYSDTLLLYLINLNIFIDIITYFYK
jgi:hypothetical protein